ncbi:uncharacterized protein F4812DRAFT_430477 [Daldinia caldariorum]|uniref:uncharacterized protein n=1 Tax=Daldinia caldariorum TaxID=326644 RepID=UPI0020081E4F|nr:uncharacterized protein F4812DRAFT_430477 [Daldinia caldariorum]KAI1467676.1 hypothetical protein F4812DRAFT_430477 [Daldinia caldariorum]
MDLQERIDWVRRQRLVTTSPSPVPAESLVERQQNPRVLEPATPSETNRRPHWRYRDPNSIKRKAPELTRDQRLEIRVLKKYHPELTYMDLSKWTGYTYHQVQRALTGPLSPRKRGYGLKNMTAPKVQTSSS